MAQKFQRLPVQKLIAVTEVRNHLGSLLNRVFRGEEHLVIEKSGIPVAAIISMKDYEQYRHYMAQQLHQEFGRKLGAEAEKQGLTEEELIAGIEEDRQTVYEEMKPARSNRVTRRKRTAADREAFLSSLGGWKDLVDTDKLIEDIYESRRISTRPRVQL